MIEYPVEPFKGDRGASIDVDIAAIYGVHDCCASDTRVYRGCCRRA